jgi:hypothetical protein
MSRTTIAAAIVFSLVARGLAGVLLEKPEGAAEVKDQRGNISAWTVGGKQGQSCSPLNMDREYDPRSVKTLEEWKALRADIRKRIVGYFGRMPSPKLPLDAKVEAKEDREDLEYRLVSIAFNKEHRGKIGLLIPKGIPAPAPAVIVYDGFGGGIDRLFKGVYSRSFGAHLARCGFVVAGLNHWYDRYGSSDTLAPLGASTHMATRAVQYLLTQPKLVDPKQIAVFGHTYGGEIAPFAAAMEERIAACVSSVSGNAVLPRHYHFPPWTGRSSGLGCVARVRPMMMSGNRPIDVQGTLPFLTQEMLALIAPRPYLGIQNSQELHECVRTVWELYGKQRALEAIEHKWKENQPVNARDYTADFFLRHLRGLKPGKCPEATAKQILAELKSADAARRLRAMRLAAWWRCKPAKGELAKHVTASDSAHRRAAAKALERIGAMDELLKHLKHPDPIVRLTVVEAMQLCGTKEAFDALAENENDEDKWVRECKAQTIQVRIYYEEE